MNVKGITPILNVSSVPASIAWFEKLGWQRAFSWNDHGMIQEAADRNAFGEAHFAGVCAGELSIFLCNGAQGSRGNPTPPSKPDDDNTPGVWMSWWLPSATDVDAAHALAVKQGIVVIAPPVNEPWGVRECRIMHPDGHTFRLSAHLGTA